MSQTSGLPRLAGRSVPPVGPRLRRLLAVVSVLIALLGANSLYLAGVTALEAASGSTYENYFYQYMFLGHLALGFVLIVPFLVFAAIHLRNTLKRRNRRAVRIGYVLLATAVLLLASGILLTRLGPLELKDPAARRVMYWLHVISPLAAVWLYWLHRLAGRPIRWRGGLVYAAAVVAVCGAMIELHRADPRRWYAVGPPEGEQYFHPSLARTATGKFIPAKALDNDRYCLDCHADIHAGWADSVHHFSSFNNPAYLASVRETREFSKKREGTVVRSRWCAGCHDPVPFFSGAFDDPAYDDVHDPTAQSGISCSVCHAITNVNSTRGNADYTIEEPLQYPFAYSGNSLLRWLNGQLIKAKPSFHKKTFLKPFHHTAEFCSTCHKVNLPEDLNDYKFLRGQNHYDSYLLSGVSGHGARSFYYPEKAKKTCAACHMPLVASNDFGAKFFAGATELSIHDHLFPAANTAVAWLRGRPDVATKHEDFLHGAARVDIFALHAGSTVDAPLSAPLRPEVPALRPGGKYLLDVVIRTLTLGHSFTQGTTDSNEVWLDVTVASGGKTIGRSGALDDRRQVDPWSHFVNVFVLDRDGNRIERRNPQDIFVPLYDNQIPPGAAQTVHYSLDLPADLPGPVTVSVKLQYRKFDAKFMDFVAGSAKPGDLPIRGAALGKPYHNDLPITTVAADEVMLPVKGRFQPADNRPQEIPAWQRWNDYGIGLLLKGKAELRQAAEAFSQVEKLERCDGPLNLARVYYTEGRLDEAVEAVRRAARYTDPPPPPWTVAWLSGLINRQQGHLAEAEQDFRGVLEGRSAEMLGRHFDFGLDYEVIDLLGETLFDRAKQLHGPSRAEARKALLGEAVAQFQKTLSLDAENVSAHYNLSLLYGQLGDIKQADRHRALHARYKPDDNARDRAVAAARKRYPAADHAAERVAIYPLRVFEEPLPRYVNELGGTP
ncbi:MAG: multiheme c-type cytochrome [Thermoguttaceae bacterium]